MFGSSLYVWSIKSPRMRHTQTHRMVYLRRWNIFRHKEEELCEGPSKLRAERYQRILGSNSFSLSVLLLRITVLSLNESTLLWILLSWMIPAMGFFFLNYPEFCHLLARKQDCCLETKERGHILKWQGSSGSAFTAFLPCVFPVHHQVSNTNWKWTKCWLDSTYTVTNPVLERLVLQSTTFFIDKVING